jgi:GT2 family glycosyltransferase
VRWCQENAAQSASMSSRFSSCADTPRTLSRDGGDEAIAPNLRSPTKTSKNDHLKTTIVVLNWNTYEMTRECVQSLLAMRGDPFDIVIVDNGSRDGSPESLRQVFPQIRVIENGRNLGFASGSNVGMQQALDQGQDYVLLVNNDTIVNPDLLVELLAESKRSPQAGMVSPKIYYADQPDRIWWAGGSFSLWQGVPRHIGWKEQERGRYETERTIDWATGCVVLIRCAALRETGLFDGRIFANAEDLDLSLRMRRLGWQVRYAPAARLWHKEGFATRKNTGEYVRYFTSTRNLLWVMHKHARWFQWLTFCPYFLVRYIFVLLVKSLCRGDVKSAQGALRGIVAFWRMKYRPDSPVLPEELIRTTLPRVEEGIVHATPTETGR